MKTWRMFLGQLTIVILAACSSPAPTILAQVTPVLTSLPIETRGPAQTPTSTSTQSATPEPTPTPTVTATPTPKLPVSRGQPFPVPIEPLAVENAYRIAELGRWSFPVGHSESRYSIAAIAVSPDGSMLALGTTAGTIDLLRASDGQQVKQLQQIQGTAIPVDLAFSPDGSRVSGFLFEFENGTVGAVHTWRVSDGQALSVWPIPQKDNGQKGTRILDWEFSPDGAFFVWSMNYGYTYVLRLSDKRVIQAYPRGTGDLAFSPDAQILVSREGSSVFMWNPQTGETLHTLGVDSQGYQILRFSPQGDRLAVGVNPSRAKAGDEYPPSQLWILKIPEGTLLHALDHEFNIQDLAFTPEGSLVATVDSYGSLRLWSTDKGTLRRTLQGLGTTNNRLVFSRDGALLFLLGNDSGNDPALRILGVISPAQGPEPTATPTTTRVPTWEPLADLPAYDDFEGAVLDPTRWQIGAWSVNPEASPSRFSYQLEAGLLSFERKGGSEFSGQKLVLLKELTRQGDVYALEARVRLDTASATQGLGAGIQIYADLPPTFWEADCEIRAQDSRDYWLWCLVKRGMGRPEHVIESIPIQLGEWHTLRIEFDRRSGHLQFYLNGAMLEKYAPLDADILRSLRFIPSLVINTSSGATISGAFDDVRLNP